MNKLKSVIQRFTGTTDLKIQISRLEKRERQAFAWQWVSRFLPEGASIPFTNWTASPELLWHLINTIQLFRYTNVLEFGGGMSTLLMANLLKKEGIPGKITCVEHDEAWAAMLQKNFDQFHLDNVEIILAPVMPGSYNPSTPWYSLEALEKCRNLGPFELVLVDGPSGLLGNLARLPAVPWLLDHQLLASSYTIVLDDYNRQDEKLIGEQWSQLTGQPLQRFGSYAIIGSGQAFQPLPFTYAQQ